MIVALTPMRGGSKGLPHKNIRPLGGVPLFHHVVLQAQAAPSVVEVWISTDSDYYASLAPAGVKVHMRSAASAQDTSPTSDVVAEFLQFHGNVSTLVLLQATSPTTTSGDIESALALTSDGYGCVTVRPHHVLLYEGRTPLWKTRQRRQESSTYREDGSIYVIHAEDFQKSRTIPTLPCQTLVLPHAVCDIDTGADLDAAQALFRPVGIATIDVGGTHVRLRSGAQSEQWATRDVATGPGALKEFILSLVARVSEAEVGISTGGVVSEDSGSYTIAEATDIIPFWQGSVIPKCVCGKWLKVQNDGDCAVMGLVRQRNLSRKNVALFVFGTGIATGLFVNGSVVKNAELLQHLEPAYTKHFANSDPVHLRNELCRIRRGLSLDEVYVSGFIGEYPGVVELLLAEGIHVVDGYFHHVGAAAISYAQRKPKHTIVIAEIGYNHQGRVDVAKTIISRCKDAGVDVVKVQKQDLGPDGRFTPLALSRPYESKNSFGATYGEHRAALELSEEDVVELQRHAAAVGVQFTSSGQDEPSFDFLDRIGVPLLKIGSGDIGNLQLIEHVAKKGKPVILSTGMADMAMVQLSVEAVLKHNPDLTLMQCTSCYPLPDSEAQLGVIEEYQKMFPGVKIGYSGHDQGLPVTLAAVAMGCEVVERHVTLDKTMKGSDHVASLDMEELACLVCDIRRIDCAMGTGVKAVQPSEHACMAKLGKCLVFKRALRRGDAVSPADVVAKVNLKTGDEVPLTDTTWTTRTMAADVDQWANVEPEHFAPEPIGVAAAATEPTSLCFVTCTRADFSKMCPLVVQALALPYDVVVWVSGMHMQAEYGSTYKEVVKNLGHTRARIVFQENAAGSMAKTYNRTTVAFERWLSPAVWMVFVHGDRLESLACATVATLKNVAVCHIEGGELSGTVDESLRHAITKLSHVHFVSNERSKTRLRQMGECPSRIHVVGSPEVDSLRANDVPYSVIKEHYAIPFGEDYFVLVYHPITIGFDPGEIEHVVDCCIRSGQNFVVIQSNNDHNSEHIANAYKRFANMPNVRYLPSMRFEYFVGLLKHAHALIGNSSVGVRETPVLGVPSLNIGSRQHNRSVESKSVLNVDDYRQLSPSVFDTLKSVPRFEPWFEFGAGNTGANFVGAMQTIRESPPTTQKYFVDLM